MIDTYSIALSALVRDFHLEILHRSTDYDAIRITVEEVARPGLQLAGFFDHYEPMRLQIMGNVEMSFMAQLPEEERIRIYDRLFSYRFPAMLIARGIQPDEQLLTMARKHDITLLQTQEPTSAIVSGIISYLKIALAPRISRHGVLIEAYGEGVLITGESGIGKSEAALELVKRGHRLIADDAVEITKVAENTLIGTSPELIRNYIELRGIGIINIAKLFGIASIKHDNEINLVVKIVPWNNHAIYDRLGLEDQYTEILGVNVPMYTIPLSPGRNLAMIIEVAAMNNRQRRMGYNAALEFTEQINRHFDQTPGGNQ